MKKLGWLLLITLILIGICSSALAINGGDNISSAVQISLNTYYTDNLPSSSAKNFYKFTLPSAGVVTVGFNHEYMDSTNPYWTVSIIDINENTYSQLDHRGNKASEEISPHYGLPAGTYYLKVVPCVFSSVDYTFRINYTQSSVWETEFNDSISKADPISVNTYYNGMIRNSSDEDYYKFTLPSAGYVTVGFKHAYIDSTLDYWRVQIIDIEQNLYSQLDHAGNIETEETSIRYGLPAGTYYVKITDYYFSNEDYQFVINYTQSSVWETELNNSITTADPINLKTYYYGNLRNSGDDDYYKFELPRDGYVTVSFSHGYVESSNDYWYVQILDSSQKTYLEKKYPGNVKKETESFKCGLSAGTYYLKVSDYYSSNQEYKFKINDVVAPDWETEFNDSITTADPVKVGGSLNGNLWKNSDKDYYCFKVTKTGVLNLYFRNEYVDSTNNIWKLTVMDEQQNSYFTQLYKGNVRKAVVSDDIKLTPGTYYLRVEPYNWSGKDYDVYLAWNRPKLGLKTAKIAVKDQTYTGSALEPKVTVTIGGDKLEKDIDYTVSYKKNKKVGLATVIITGKGEYSGTAEGTFQIKPVNVKSFSITAKKTKMTLKWKQPSDINGYEIQYSLKKDFSKYTPITIKKAKTTEKQIWFLKKGRTYYVRIRTYKIVDGKKYYSFWSDVKKVKMKGTAANEDEEPENEFDSPHN